MAKEEKTVEQIAEEINASIEGLKKSINDKADLSKLEDRFAAITSKLDKLVDKDGNVIVPETVSKQQEQLDEISTQLKQLGELQKNKGESIGEQVLKHLKSDDFREKMKTQPGIRTGGLDFEVKAANIDTADINSGTIETQTELGVSAAPWRNTPIWDNIVKGVIGQGRDSISWWEETTRTDNAGMVAEEAAPATGSAKTWTKQSMNIMRMADFTKVSREALEDFEYINSGTIETQTELGVSAAPWRNTPIWDNIVKGVIGQGRDSISWWEETTRTDSAVMVAEEAAPATGSAKTWTKQSMNIMRMADFTKVSREALEDFEYINSEVNDLISNGIPRKRETELLSGAGSTIYLKGITQYAKTFALPANFDKVPEANDGDVLAAAILQCMNGYTTDTNKKGFAPNVIMLNPGSAINMRLLKNANYSYLQHPLLSPDGSLFKGVRIIENLDMTAGTFLVGDFSRAKAYVKRNMQISFHYENEDDAKTDLVLVMATMRLAGLKVSAADAYAFVYGTFASAQDLIEEVVA